MAADYFADIKGRLDRAGRDPDSCKILFGVQPIVGATEDEAREKQAIHNSLVPLEGGLAILSGLKPRQAGGWEGRIYNPEDGQTYRATVSRNGADTLQVEGCVLFVCQKQVWWKASVLAEALR